jgi:hypothetical protein
LNLPNESREGNHSSLVKYTIFSQESSPRFFVSGRSTYFFEISVKICTLTPFSASLSFDFQTIVCLLVGTDPFDYRP